MKRINSVIKGKGKKIQTTDVMKISYYVRDHNPSMTLEDAEDYNANSQYLVSDNGKFIAKYNKELNAVGFYEESGEDVKHLTHTTPEKLEGTVFTIEEETEIDLVNDVLPQGDILIKFTDGDFYLPDNESVSNTVNYLVGNDWDMVDEVIYTGLSKGKGENCIVDFDSSIYHEDLFDDDDYDDEVCENYPECNCGKYCSSTGEYIGN
ncbi:hypothetical protein [Staphylococcus phage vB_Sau_P68]|nr:hypothetical protein [Staphylococcus phage vB_Sau_P68]